MKQLSAIFLFITIFFSLGTKAQKNIFISKKFDQLSQHHETLAILPFLTHLELENKPDKTALGKLQRKEGLAVQNALETYFSNKKKRKKFSVNFQNTTETNAILAKNNISYANIYIHTPKELCKILGVDGIISGNLELNILLSKGVSDEFSIFDYFTGKANYGRIGMKISDANTGKLLWKYEKGITKKSGKDTYALIDDMMKKAARKFPYEREKNKNIKNNN